MPPEFPHPEILEAQSIHLYAKCLLTDCIRYAARNHEFQTESIKEDRVLSNAQPHQTSVYLGVGADSEMHGLLWTTVAGLYRPAPSLWQKCMSLVRQEPFLPPAQVVRASLPPAHTNVLLRRLPQECGTALIRHAYATRYADLLSEKVLFPFDELLNVLARTERLRTRCAEAARRIFAQTDEP